MKNAVIFDLDGTLWDSSRQVSESWNAVMEKYPESRECKISVSDMRGFMGKPMDSIAALMMPNVPEKLRRKIMLECMDYELKYLESHTPVFYPKLRETLEELHKSRSLIIVSNCQDGYIQLFLKLSNTQNLFCDYESYGKTGLSKGENIRLVIERNSIDKAVYVGDTQGDLDAADYAGVEFIHAAYGFGRVNRETKSISELTNVVFRE